MVRRDLERQFDTVLFERVVLSPAKVSPLVTQILPGAASVFKDSYLDLTIKKLTRGNPTMAAKFEELPGNTPD